MRFRTASVAAVALSCCLLWAAPAMAVEAPDWIYGSGVAKTDERGITISTGDAPGGAGWDLELDPAKRYRVTVQGIPGAGRFNLRSQADQGPLEYGAAPDGVVVQRFSEVSELQLLVYSDEVTADYLVQSVSVEDCTTTCKDDGDLRAEILADTPGLADLLADGEQQRAAEAILAWATPRIPYAFDPEALRTKGLTASEIYYDHFEPGVAGVYCGGAADLMHKILELFDIDSFVIDFGVPETFLTHVTVILERPAAKAADSYRLLDPTFGLTLTGGGGRPMTLGEAFRLRNGSREDVVEPATLDLSDRPLIRREDGGQLYETSCAEAPGNAYCNLNDYLENWADTYELSGYEPGVGGLIDLLASSPLHNVAAQATPADFIQWREKAADSPLPTADLPVSNDELGAAAALDASSAVKITAVTLGATAQADEPDHAGQAAGASVWFRWEAPASGATMLDTCATDFDSVLSVYRMRRGGLVPVAADDDGCGAGGGSRVEFAATANADYRIAVDGYRGDAGVSTLSLAAPSPQPSSEPPPEPPLIPASPATDPGSDGPTEAAETPPPIARIVAGPEKRTRRSLARFKLAAGDRAVRFRCALDGGNFRPCQRRHSVRVGPGRHRLRVLASNGTSGAGGQVAVWRWHFRPV